MATNLFDGFKGILDSAVSDEDFRRKNSLFQDDDYLADVQARINSLTADVSILLTFDDVISALGLAYKDAEASVIRFDPKGFETTLSAFREGNITTPRRIWRRPASTATDELRYLLADGGEGALTSNGVLALSPDLEALYRFPGFGTDLVGNDEYDDSADAVTFTIGTVEYIAIACTEHHCVQIYEFADPYTYTATIGTIDTEGVDATGLTEPWSLAIDETNSLLYIACKTGQPAAASAANGFVAVWDVSIPAAPVYSETPFYYGGSGQLIDGEVWTPNDVFFEDDTLWVSNGGDNTVGGFDLSGTVPICRKYLPAAGDGYILRSPQQVSVQQDLGGFKKVFVANQDTGTIEEFDYTTMSHSQVYGIRASEDEIGSYNRMSTDVYGALGSPQGVVGDIVNIEDQDTNVIVVTDTLNKRLHRFNQDAYGVDNFVNFADLTFDVPVVVNGWTVNGSFPIDLTTVYYRFSVNDTWKQLPQETSLPATSAIQLRLNMKLDARRFVRSDWYISHLRINGEQA
jgi:hypothetical protein